WSRQGDGRLTLKGGVREVLAARYLEALGVKTSKLFSLVETGEALTRGDEPSPTRSAVMVRLSETHIRFGSFQRAMALGETENLARLVNHAVKHYHPDAADPDMARQTAALLHRIAEAAGRMIGQWMASGFVHGVMNTDNFNITGETFDFGPYRFLPKSDPNFTAAYFDQQGLYRFGRQPTQGLWALQQLASALSPLAEVDSLTESLKAYEPAYQQSFIDQTCHLLGVETGVFDDDIEFLSLFYAWMTETECAWPQVFFDWYGGPASEARAKASPLADLYAQDLFAPVKSALMARAPIKENRLDTAYFQSAKPESLLIDEIETIWAAIAEHDDWSLFDSKLDRLAELEAALST
ncbi:MAG: protein adenylyltransferase SelO family protein, partial [Hyphomonadaceae bacterium]